MPCSVKDAVLITGIALLLLFWRQAILLVAIPLAALARNATMLGDYRRRQSLLLQRLLGGIGVVCLVLLSETVVSAGAVKF